MKDRNKWLQGKIKELENKEMFDELSWVDKIFLGGYREELKMIAKTGNVKQTVDFREKHFESYKKI